MTLAAKLLFITAVLAHLAPVLALVLIAILVTLPVVVARAE
jgi:hypothetical protein